MSNASQAGLIAREPGDRTDGARGKYETIAQPPWRSRKGGSQLGRDGHPTGIVVGKRRMADVGGDQDLSRRSSRQIALRVAQAPRGEAGIDADLVAILAQRLQIPVPQTEAPGGAVVAGAIRDPVRMLGHAVQVWPQLGERHRLPHRHRVAHHMQIGLLEIDDAPALGVLDVGVLDVPLLRHLPIENRRAARNLVALQRDACPDQLERPANPVPGDAAADREQLAHELIGPLADSGALLAGLEVLQGHQLCSARRAYSAR